jgi:predicted histidine transporter YuiF (NhaC family)
MELIEYITGKGGIMILGLIVVVVFVYRKYKEKRYFKDIEKRMNKRNQTH